MFGVSREEVAQRRKDYPAGTRIQLISMPNDPCGVPPGACGTVRGVDDAGQLMMRWDTGSGLSLIPGEDIFRVI